MQTYGLPKSSTTQFHLHQAVDTGSQGVPAAEVNNGSADSWAACGKHPGFSVCAGQDHACSTCCMGSVIRLCFQEVALAMVTFHRRRDPQVVCIRAGEGKRSLALPLATGILTVSPMRWRWRLRPVVFADPSFWAGPDSLKVGPPLPEQIDACVENGACCERAAAMS